MTGHESLRDKKDKKLGGQFSGHALTYMPTRFGKGIKDDNACGGQFPGHTWERKSPSLSQLCAFRTSFPLACARGPSPTVLDSESCLELGLHAARPPWTRSCLGLCLHVARRPEKRTRADIHTATMVTQRRAIASSNGLVPCQCI